MPKYTVHVAKNGFGWLFKGISASSKNKAMKRAVDRWDYKMQTSGVPFFNQLYVNMIQRPYRVTVFQSNRAIHSMLMKRANENRLKEVM